jgi:ring-1,2-phenylacetyl-CoA epoxidase subunit PaaB
MTDTQWKIFEVFHQQARGEPHIHVGSIHAPDAEMALLLAKEQFARRQACVNLWVVPIECISASKYEDSDIFERATDKSYRESWGYKTPKTIVDGKKGRRDVGT